ncbi:S8 family serine peptidase [Maribellus sp. YY47]|uniref:S8 family serine peptidase n=1 Tax=Maribellus sp. YY47 TaxID=2929486 RepID=UPI0020011F58|nr:S8 family serine peptidase [Maribellus sp. YY47]MCK3685314.1 S8 family serine peptidase [Maribellus sp. YY47]
MKKLIFALVALLAFQPLTAQNKIKIERAEDLPKHYYDLKGNKAMDYINNRDLLLELAATIESDLKDDLEKYDIQDKATLRGYHSNFSTISFLKNDLQPALDQIYAGRKLTEKESDKYLWNLTEEVYIKTRLEDPDLPEEAFKAAFKKNLEAALEKIPFAVVQEDVEGMTGSLDILTANLIQGIIEGQLQPIIDKADKQVPAFVAKELLGMRMTYDMTLPYVADVYKPVFQAYYDKNHVDVTLVDIWKDRDADLDNNTQLKPVVVGIWDTGVDEAVLPENNRWVNKAEKPDGKDDDNNGFVDDVHGIAYDLKGNKVSEILFPIAEINANYQQYEKYIKGLMDLQAMIKSEEADELKKYISTLAPEEVNPFIENLGMYGNFSHGTHVAGIAAKGNPQARILAARLTFPYENIPAPPTLETSKNWVELYKNTVQYFKDHQVRVVNMSWGYSQNYYESLLAMNGIGENEEERKALAQKLFGMEKDALYTAMKEAPEILFVVAAGNANNDIDFANNIPSGLTLPNLMKVGAVDIEGKETSFTTIGKGVDVYSNGYEVESFIPGGEKRKYSGTSMASPQVVNLAAKLWATNPGLSVAEVKDLIIKGATPSTEKPDILLIHPQQSLKMLE